MSARNTSISEAYLRKRIMSDANVRAVFESAPDAHLVGGYVRDLIHLGKKSVDVDFVVPRSKLASVTSDLAKALEGSLVELKPERLKRVVLKSGRNLDFSPMNKSIEADLKSRDFPFNAMAWNPGSGLIDPLGGLQHLGRRVVRAVSKHNLAADPLRMLRAYRFSAAFNWNVQSTTRRTIRSMAPLITGCKSERITLELYKLLMAKHPEDALKMALEDDILSRIIPLKNKDLYRNIQLFSRIDSNLKKLPKRYMAAASTQGLDFRGILRLEALVLGASPDSIRLSLSNDIRRRITAATAHYDAFRSVRRTNLGRLYELFSTAHPYALDLLVLSRRIEMLKQLRRFNRIQGKGMLKAVDLMMITGLGEGPELGAILASIRENQFTGRIRTRKQAERFAIKQRELSTQK